MRYQEIVSLGEAIEYARKVWYNTITGEVVEVHRNHNKAINDNLDRFMTPEQKDQLDTVWADDPYMGAVYIAKHNHWVRVGKADTIRGLKLRSSIEAATHEDAARALAWIVENDFPTEEVIIGVEPNRTYDDRSFAYYELDPRGVDSILRGAWPRPQHQG